ncbi:MAG: hypothetical protein HN623_08425 [Bdellovibrionales bacterium]|nr:hypothetical protein [Bdellovibrionales bacterium]
MTKDELITCYKSLGGNESDLLELSSTEGDKPLAASKLAYYQDLIPHKLLVHAINCEIENFIALDAPNCEANLRLTLDLVNRESFIKDPFVCFFESFNPGVTMDESNSLHYTIKSSGDKNDMRLMVDHFLDSIPKVKRFRDDIALVADELFTNAVFNTPFSDVAQDRTGFINLNKLQQGELKVMHTPGNIHIGCSDPHGGLRVYKLLNKLKNIYDRGVGKTMNMNAQEGGGGIGHWMMYERTESILLAVQKEIKTVVIFTVPLTRCKSEFGWNKSMHLCEF